VRNLLRFIFKNHFVFLFVLVELFSLILVIRFNNLQREKFINSSNVIIGALNSSIDGATQYLSLRTVNKTLAQENANLRRKLRNSKFELLVKHQLANDTAFGQQYMYIPARVINNSINRQKNYLTLNKGSRQGVEKDMAVISSTGIVGIVNSVSNNFSTVISVLHRDFRVSAKFAGSDYFGSVYWDGRNESMVQMADIPYHVSVKRGQKIVTNAFSNIYPADIAIGRVDTFSVDKHKNFYDIQVTLATDFRSLEYVYVVTDLLKKERKKLEKGRNE